MSRTPKCSVRFMGHGCAVLLVPPNVSKSVSLVLVTGVHAKISASGTTNTVAARIMNSIQARFLMVTDGKVCRMRQSLLSRHRVTEWMSRDFPPPLRRTLPGVHAKGRQAQGRGRQHGCRPRFARVSEAEQDADDTLTVDDVVLEVHVIERGAERGLDRADARRGG
jgi:hypothetical protein